MKLGLPTLSCLQAICLDVTSSLVLQALHGMEGSTYLALSLTFLLFRLQVTLTDNTLPLLINLRDSVRTLLCESEPPNQTPSKDTPPDNTQETQKPQALSDREKDFQRSVQRDPLDRSADTPQNGNQSTSVAARIADDAARPPVTFTGGRLQPSGLPPLGIPVPSGSSISGTANQPGLGPNQNLNDGPDPVGRAHLIQNRLQSPTAAFNGLSFRSPPLGPQPFVSLNAPPFKERFSQPPSNLPVSKPFFPSWDSWYEITAEWASEDSASQRERSADGVTREDDAGVNGGAGGGMNGAAEGGVNGGASLVRVRQLEWDEDGAALGERRGEMGRYKSRQHSPNQVMLPLYSLHFPFNCCSSNFAFGNRQGSRTTTCCVQKT